MKKFSQTTRNYGIDLLKIVSMLMVIILHILGHGGMLKKVPFLSAKYEMLWLLEISCFCAVNCYALASGYVGCCSRYRYSNLILLWLRVLFYTIIITTIFFMVLPSMNTSETWVNAFFPVSMVQYWYFSAYVLLFFFIPFLNIVIKTLSKKQMEISLGFLFVLFSVLPSIFKKDIFIIVKGYSGLWLIFLYLVGGYLRKYHPLKKIEKVSLISRYLGLIFLTWLVKFCEEFFTQRSFSDDYLVTYNSLTIAISSVFLLCFFERLKLSLKVIKVIKIFAPAVFSVYLIHVHPLIWKYVWHNAFLFLTDYPLPLMLISIIVIACIVFLVCCIIDFIREILFKQLCLKDKLSNFEIKLTRGLWN